MERPPVWPWVVGGAATVALVAGVVYLIRQRDRDTVPAPTPRPFVPQHTAPQGGLQGTDLWGGPMMPEAQAVASIDVRTAQRYLQGIGHTQVILTGTLDPVTQTALRAYQEAAGIPVTGVLDAASKSQIAQDIGRIAY